jgi:Copper type II ascorbate-dependent monooxygenase, C-terminal domain
MTSRIIRSSIVGLLLILLAAAAFVRIGQVGASAREVTFTRDIAPIFFNKCTECHRPGEIAPMSLLAYKEARPWSRSIREKVVTREMPPWHADPSHGEFANDRSLTQKEIDVIASWVDGGSKEGNPVDLPAAPTYADGWSIGKPDVVLTMAQEYTVEAKGPDEYQYFPVPTRFTEDRFIQAVEVRPGNRKVVHHLVVFVQPPPPKATQPNPAASGVDSKPAAASADTIQYRDGFVTRTKQDAPVYDDGCSLPNGGGGLRRDVSKLEPVPGILAEYLPGNRGEVMDSGSAKRVPAGSTLLFQVHYAKTTGEVQKDRSSIGLIFAKSPPRKLVATRLVFNGYFSIPPGASSHRTTACWTLPDDAEIVSMTPHMHFRGKAMEIKAIYPDGRSQVLLNVPVYKFAWQTIYYLNRPLAVPKGTRIAVTSLFDNSPDNKYNPDPTRAVRWGDPTYDEMLAAFIDYSVKLGTK